LTAAATATTTSAAAAAAAAGATNTTVGMLRVGGDDLSAAGVLGSAVLAEGAFLWCACF
jgi:hypothetical protein